MRTDKQRAASRSNGSRSRGPVSAAGKERSAMNALKHGLTGDFVLLPGESHSAFEHLRQAYVTRIQPQDPVEYSLVEQLIQCDWELHRAWSDQRIATILRIDDQRVAFEREFVGGSPALRITRARQEEFADDGFCHRMERHIVRIDNRMTRALRRLILLRQHFPFPDAPPVPQSANEQNEPNRPQVPVESVGFGTAPVVGPLDVSIPPGHPASEPAGCQNGKWQNKPDHGSTPFESKPGGPGADSGASGPSTPPLHSAPASGEGVHANSQNEPNARQTPLESMRKAMEPPAADPAALPTPGPSLDRSPHQHGQNEPNPNSVHAGSAPDPLGQPLPCPPLTPPSAGPARRSIQQDMPPDGQKLPHAA